MSESVPTSPMPPPFGPSPPAGPDLTGRTLKDFRVLRKLGQGGMGQVYLAEQVSLKRKVALKVLRPDLAADPVAVQRFKAEAEAVARITHGNIVQVYAHDEADGVQFIALEYVEGKNLRDYLARRGPPDLFVALSLMRQMAAALQRAGEMGIVHRDVKPENILLTRRGEVKVADFGLSRCLDAGRPAPNLTQSGTTMGTPLYMSPEQVEGKPLDPRTDIYSLGVTCYHMLSGQPPFRGESAFEVALQHVRDEPVPLGTIRTDLPQALCAIVHKMMAKDPAQRYQTGRELYRELTRLRETLSGTTGALSPPTVTLTAAPTATPTRTMPLEARPAPAPRRRWRPLLVALSLAAALAAGAAAGWARRHNVSPLAPGVTPPPDESEVTRDTPQKHEQALRGLVEGALSSPKRDNLQEVFPLCRQLGLFYLEAGRLDDARHLFTRLSEATQVPEYQVLGLYGLGIVCALRNQPKESNRLFELAVRKQAQARGQPRRLGLLRLELWQKAKWRYWVHKALHYNEQNDPTVTPPRFLVQRLYT